MAGLTPTNRFRIEVIGAGITLALGVLTLLVPAWIEAVFGVDPDQGDGSLEMVIVLVCACATVSLGMLAWADHRKSIAG